jgi:hypothetical protein
MGGIVNTLTFDRLILKLKKIGSNDEKAELYRSLSEEATALADSLAQEDPVMPPLKIETDGFY